MKQVVFMCVSGVLVVLSITAIVVLWSRQSRKNDLEQALAVAEEQTLQSIERGKEDSPKNSDEMKAEFLQLLFHQVNSGSNGALDKNQEIMVNIAECDPDKGIISASVRETFTYPGGKTGQVTAKRTAVRECKTEKKLVSVVFSGLKTYMLEEGEQISNPGTAYIDGREIKGWKDADGNEVNLPQNAEGDMILYPEL